MNLPKSLGNLLLFAGLLVLVLALTAPYGGTQQNQNETNRTFAPAAYGTADSNGSMIAVTGVDLTGSSILYLIDTASKQLAVYQASGGTDSMQEVRLVGARRIDRDLQLWGYNDKSKYSYEDLLEKFQANDAPTDPGK